MANDAEMPGTEGFGTGLPVGRGDESDYFSLKSAVMLLLSAAVMVAA